MSTPEYSLSYFERYLQPSRFGRRVLGEKSVAFWTRRIASKVGDGARLLEVGAGTGHFGAEASKRFRYVGTDISPDAVAWGRENLGVDLQLADAQNLPFGDNSFDVVVAFDLVEHLPDPESFFREAARVLRCDGFLHVRTPNTRSLGVRLKDGRTGLTPSMYLDATHCSLLPPGEWLAAARHAGFRVTGHGTDGLWDFPYTTAVPSILQKVALMPLNGLLNRTLGYLPWSIGENFFVEARRLA